MSLEHTIQRLMSGQAKGLFPSLGRSALALIEPVYRFEVNRRNRRFDRDVSCICRLPRPVISVGNLTTGGTGKTPVIRWLAGELRDRGLRVGILARGYKAAPGTLGDEQRMLLAMLGARDRGAPTPHGAEGGDPIPHEYIHEGGAGAPPSRVVIECNPDRYAAGLRALEQHPEIDLFLLDDGFQHRRLHRDLDIVLLHAPEPFGYRHVLPRGMLREPINGLKRAGVVVLTSADAATQENREVTITEIRRHNAAVPILFERHEPTGLRSATTPSHLPVNVPLSSLAERSVMCFSGLGSPGGFERQVRSLARKFVGEHRFPDHHGYTVADLKVLKAKAAGADVLVTTEKDWVKLAAMPDITAGQVPIWRLDVEARFEDDGKDRIINAALAAMGPSST